MKIAIVSWLLPPTPSGQSTMLYRLLKDVPAEDYCLISTAETETVEEEPDRVSHRLSGKYFRISRGGELTRGYRLVFAIARELYNVTVGAFLRARQIARIVHEENCQAVMSCSSGNDLLDVPSGFIASRLARVPFYLYLFDTYSQLWTDPRTRSIGRRVESFVLRRAEGVIVTNETACDLLRERYGVESIVIHNPCDLATYESHAEPLVESTDREIRIVYTGAISEAHYDAFTNLIEAIKLLGNPNVKLHIYTSVSPSKLIANGISGPVVFHEHQSVFAVSLIQRQADVLFLPLAFTSPFPELIKISSPSKVGEFLASHRPVLVHAPRDSFLVSYFREHDCGLVVDEYDSALLAGALGRLLSDRKLRHRLSSNAWNRAVLDFSLEQAQAAFLKILDLRPAETN